MKILKKALIILSTILSVVFIIACMRVAGAADNINNVSSTPENKSASIREPLYIITTHEGQIGVFKYKETTPYLTLDDVMIDSLSEYDQKLLESGIQVYSEQELLSLIEDYDS